ncbi:MAG: mechanosensitive ion channel family protein [Kiritimatiellales bacterium]|nr:mechanosensitive ion channel family protein [Kiritimatiellales bacterium]
MTDKIDSIVLFIQQYSGLTAELQVKLFKTVVAGAVFYLVLLGIRRLIHWRIKDRTKQYLARKTAGYATGFMVVLFVWRIWFGQGLATYIGILSAGLAIALKDPLANLAAWLYITVRKPFSVGDRIAINGSAGDVIDQSLFSFTLVEIGNWVDADQSTGRIIHIPNGWLFQYSIQNYNQGFNFIWNELPVLVTFESDWKKTKEILSDTANRHSAVKSEYAAQQIRRAARQYLIHFEHLTPIVWTDVKDSGVQLTIRYLCEPRRRRSTASGIWEDILEEFAKHSDIEFAYPTQRFYDNAREGNAAGPAPQTGPQG